MPRRFTRFDNMEFPAYTFKPYPSIITVGRSKKDERRMTVHSEDEEKAAYEQFGGQPRVNEPRPQGLSGSSSAMGEINAAQAKTIAEQSATIKALQDQMDGMANMIKALQQGGKSAAKEPEPVLTEPAKETDPAPGAQADAVQEPTGDMAHLNKPRPAGRLKLS